MEDEKKAGGRSRRPHMGRARARHSGILFGFPLSFRLIKCRTLFGSGRGTEEGASGHTLASPTSEKCVVCETSEAATRKLSTLSRPLYPVPLQPFRFFDKVNLLGTLRLEKNVWRTFSVIKNCELLGVFFEA